MVLFCSGYSDKYYKPLPEGRRFSADPVEGKTPAWPDPDPDCMEYLASRKVMALGTDSASMGPLPDLAEPTHLRRAQARHDLDRERDRPRRLARDRGVLLHARPQARRMASTPKARAIAIVGEPLAAPADRVGPQEERRRSLGLAGRRPSPYLAWPGRRQPPPAVHEDPASGSNPNPDTPSRRTCMDSHAGTHLVPPSYALPRGLRQQELRRRGAGMAGRVRGEVRPAGTSDITTEQVPLAQTCGPARVIDVQLAGRRPDRKSWPASPEITVADIRKLTSPNTASLKPGDIVIFRSGWSDRYYRPLPEGKALPGRPAQRQERRLARPWARRGPVPGQEGHPLRRHRRPDAGRRRSANALMTYWALGGKDMAGVEYLTGVGQCRQRAYFLFAAVKIRGCHGGHRHAVSR